MLHRWGCSLWRAGPDPPPLPGLPGLEQLVGAPQSSNERTATAAAGQAGGPQLPSAVMGRGRLYHPLCWPSGSWMHLAWSSTWYTNPQTLTHG